MSLSSVLTFLRNFRDSKNDDQSYWQHVNSHFCLQKHDILQADIKYILERASSLVEMAYVNEAMVK